jgi:signal peptidase II
VPAKSKLNDLVIDTRVPRSRYLVFFSLAILGCAADLCTKSWVFRWRGMPRPGNEWWIWPDYVGIETALNPGALFGMGGQFTQVFSLLSIVAAIGIAVWLFPMKAAREWPLTIALGAVMGGILGNLYDRLGLWEVPGAPDERILQVRDWILLRYGEHTWPNFNIADCLLVGGSILLVWHGLLGGAADRGQPPAAD